MHPTTKRYLIFGFTSLILIGLAIIVTRPKTPTAPKLPPPKESANIMQGLSIELSENLTLEDIPKSLPLIEVNYEKITKSQAKQIASKLDFFDEPQVITDINRGDIYLWKNPTHFLMITPSTSTIEYGDLVESEKINFTQYISEKEIVEISSTFLQKLFNTSLEEFELDSINYLIADPYGESVTQTSQAQANVYQVNFTYKTNNVRIINLNLLESVIFVRLYPDGSISSAHVKKIENISESKKQHALKNLEEIKNSLSEAILFSLDNNNINIADLDKKSIKNIKIDKITLAYLSNISETKSLQPVFILKGIATLNDSSTLKAHLYLRAIKIL